MRTWFSVVAACGFLAGCSPFGGGAFSCERDDQCGAGKCTSGYCSFADSSCATGYRFGAASGSLANTCVGDPSTIDASELDAKAVLDGPPAGLTWFGTGFGKTCFADGDVPNAATSIVAAVDTSTSNLCSTTVVGSPPYCVIAGTEVTVTGMIAVTGSKPLVIVATGTLTIESIDIASHRATAQVGAASVPTDNVTLCDPGTAPNNNAGGAGGSFGTNGAAGGKGGNSNGGTPGATKAANTLRGGCYGQDGKSGTPGVKGVGGGALYLIAGTQIIVNGTINASGAAGTGAAANKGGGGGGGTGGLIGLDSPLVTNNGAIFANGGGGGEGAGQTNSNGNDGNEPTTIAAAPKTASNSNGGDGGAGGADTAAGAGANANQDGGGGGGGGAGAIRLFGATTIAGNAVSPPAQ